MPVTLNLIANVIDIEHDTPRECDGLIVDSNVWYWVTYSRASICPHPPRPYQTGVYPNYVHAALSSGARLYYSGLSLAELAHRIEAVERDIFCAQSRTTLNAKEFRHNYPAERARVVSEITAAWRTVESIGTLLSLEIDAPHLTSALSIIGNHPVDGYDAFLISTVLGNTSLRVLTDDGDYATVPGLTILTANQTVLNEARRTAHLVVR